MVRPGLSDSAPSSGTPAASTPDRREFVRQGLTLGVAGASLDLVEVAGVLDGLKVWRGGHETSLDAGTAANKDMPAPR